MKGEDIKVGQRVCCTGGPAFLEGWVGTCTYIASVNQVAIEFDKAICLYIRVADVVKKAMDGGVIQ